MKKMFQLIYSNKFFAFLMLIIQLTFLVAGYIWLANYSRFFFGANTVLSLVMIIYEINRDDEASFKLTWVILMAVVPIFGTLFYLYTRVNVMERTMNTAQKQIHLETSTHLCQSEEVIKEIAATRESSMSFIKYITKYGGCPAYKNTAVKYYPLGDYMFEDIKKELQKAQKFIFLEFFIINIQGRMWGEVLEILKNKVRAGVDVRVLYDGMGCMTTLPRHYPEQLRKMGIKCEIFSPIQPLLSTYQNNRDHRKIISIDGKVAFCGGINLADEYINEINRFGHWKDTGVMLVGEAASGFTGMFLETWNMMSYDENEKYEEYMKTPYSVEADGIVIPFGDSPLDEINLGKRVYVENLNTAKNYVHIMTPYLVIDGEILDAMKYASQRGVEVEIIMPHIPDKAYAFWLARTYYPELIKAGVKIYEYTPGFVHAKVSVADGDRAVVGTINYDYRSLYLHYECAAYLMDVPAIMDIESDFEDTRKKSKQITMQEYKKFNIFTRMIGKATRVLAPIL